LRIKRSLVAIGAVGSVAAMVAFMAPMAANADPINPTNGKSIEPAAYDIVSAGSESLSQVENQLSFNYNKTISPKEHSPAHPWLFSWDAVPLFDLNDVSQPIVLKAGCKKNIRPDGSSDGIKDMLSYGNTSYTYKGKKHTAPCIDFARSSRPRKGGSSGDPPLKSGVGFVTLARDDVTYATTSNSYWPNNLTNTQLVEIFGCEIPAKNGDPANSFGAMFGNAEAGKHAKTLFDVLLPQAGSGTLSFWMETALGFSGDDEPTCGAAAKLKTDQQPEENEGTNKLFGTAKHPNPAAIYPFSVGVYLAQEFHSAACGKKPSKTQNMFGCDQNGVLNLRDINGVSPTAKGPGKTLVTNITKFSDQFRRFLYDVVRTNAAGDMPSYLEGILGPKGYYCKQAKVLATYGFVSTPACGLIG
jgi:ABC-type phosphate transport system substrate-binding protein